MNPLVFALPGLVAGGVIALFAAIARAEKRRSEDIELASQTMGFSYQRAGDLDALRAFADLPLFSRGTSRKVRNLITGRAGGGEVRLFDYSYTVAAGEHSRTDRQTVALFPAGGSMPDFVMAPENFFHRIGQLFGYQDIDFEQDTGFSSHYLLRGSDETAIRSAFGSDVLAFFAGERGWTVEARNGVLGIYRARKRCKPAELAAFLSDAQRVWQAFGRRER